MLNAKEILAAALKEATTQHALAMDQLTIAEAFYQIMLLAQATARERVSELTHLLEVYPDK